MTSDFILARCSRCFLRRRLQLAYADRLGEMRLCRSCMGGWNKEVAGTRGMATRFGEVRTGSAEGTGVE